jgi:hypothetical protein
MATSRRTRSYRDGSKRTSGSGALLDTVKNTFGQLTGNRGNRARSSRGGGNLAAQASGFIGGLLSGGDNRRSGRNTRSGRSGGNRRRR